ncbi:MAG TPA: tripartite tricarboxylate transporter substrate binding protein [Alicycliphilus sp.]|jgi:tripartite-type tricarboxylate transporter receptor subunit TctC|uniref:Tripartite tricarboxylate transporter substrate binding protein n=1 Tax=Diaphorobacter limosus TaxID=3036128 RepID=A0ABZ0J2S3_9BURK|nr:tripartite tricarboxylate transporter substrate binding protein [Diaphorobacter sp. Y-1]MBP7325981.1 tripartite tricarboxylate transporter substrate binding protein [Alicycliphilus sp.]MCA0441069.1 tripartite tricarboxylate transporter substrate binding protein [Pseudomonadota bacterium]MBP7329765.1 tripartite tricarboxylate transporter substrate binding protein [Alicycliphilus sp.]MBP8779992.1 tripartite tricarboxylate transporter substrate binding protein [Alicycliphilus sp.]WOO31219.1 tr
MQTLLRGTLAAALAFSATATLAQAYPDKPVTLVVPFAAGSGTDSVARAVASGLAARLKQPVIVDNKPGASAQVAAQYVAKAKPDGYTLFMTTNTSHSANPALYKSLKYDPIKDFTPVARVGELPFALAVNPAVPAKTLAELLDYARANPGKLSYATPNSTSLVAMESIKHIAKIDVLGVPYKSSPQAMTDLVGGQVQIYVADLGSGMGMLKTDKVRALGVTTAQPTPMLPGVPPIGQTVKGFDLTSWNGIFGPAGLPQPMVQRLNTELQAVLADKDLQDKLAQIGFQVWPSKTPEEFTQYVAGQLTHWRTLIQQAGIQPE